LLRYLLDTDICSYIIRDAYPALLKKIRATEVGEQGISVVTKAELLLGVRMSPRPDKDATAVVAFFSYVDILPMDDAAAQHFADVRADLKKRGTMIGANDLWIAAHARSLGLILVTNNTREFARVPGLKLENWIL
jgi:tRNA(fMet)-specific endonuclease VapC